MWRGTMNFSQRSNRHLRTVESGESATRPDSRGRLSPRGSGKLHAVRALSPDVTIVHLQRADRDGNSHCWGNFGVMIEAVRAAKRVIVVAEEIVEAEVIASDPNRTVIPGFLVDAVVECRYGAHPSPVQGYYKRDDAFFRQYHEQTKTEGRQRGVAAALDLRNCRSPRIYESARGVPRGRVGSEAARLCGAGGFWVLKTFCPLADLAMQSSEELD